ncbi:uncharacterized protein LOC123538594 isoform X2 [Mercenaria mercenaria]|uniref:uncharacterized protein LOC123538594 isoform X2 n=1 Tax=Mercenaria mercenaria TaxID=6596 RepID=UPI00234FAB2E|nr:uncharacterized protein LOC123538594 isoform X2 [Mercenaria mercenaria]
MMKYSLRSKMQVSLVVLYIGEIMFPPVYGGLQANCTQTIRTGHDFQVKVVLPTYINASEFRDPPFNFTGMTLELCPNNVTLKISWSMDKTSGTEMKLCFRIKSDLNGKFLHTECVELNMNYSKHPIVMTCWFPMDYVSYMPIIDAMATLRENAERSYFYGELNTRDIDPTRSCEDMCEVSEMIISPVNFCNHTASVVFNENITIHALSFDASDSCKDSPIHITGMTTKKFEFTLTCTYDGIGHVKVLYSINGKYCLKYQPVTVICVSQKKVTDSKTLEPEVDDFKTFVIFGLVCMIVITAIFVVTILVAQWLRQCFKDRRRYSGRDVNICTDEGMPFKVNSFQQKGNDTPSTGTLITPVDQVIKREYRKHVDSISSSDVQFANIARSLRGQTARKLHRSITMALLENMESFDRKKILFLPTPFDTFSRDATNLLKTVFTLELSIPTQCCFDRDVNKRYRTGDRYKWIESILGDFDRIVIFLCFTKIRGQTGDSAVEGLLDHLPLSKVRPHCKVAFLHITDSSESLEKNHHGDCFHLSDKNSYEVFVGAVLKYCGRNPLAEQDLMARLTNCKASRHFLRFIGKDKKHH